MKSLATLRSLSRATRRPALQSNSFLRIAPLVSTKYARFSVSALRKSQQAGSSTPELDATQKGSPSAAIGTGKRLPEFSLVDKVVCVSGAARGLGLVQAEALLEAGATGKCSHILLLRYRFRSQLTPSKSTLSIVSQNHLQTLLVFRSALKKNSEHH